MENEIKHRGLSNTQKYDPEIVRTIQERSGLKISLTEQEKAEKQKKWKEQQEQKRQEKKEQEEQRERRAREREEKKEQTNKQKFDREYSKKYRREHSRWKKESNRKWKEKHPNYWEEYWRKISEKQKKRKVKLPPPKTFLTEKKSQIKLIQREKLRYSYYCKECEEDFQSKLPLEEAICIKCGSSKIRYF